MYCVLDPALMHCMHCLHACALSYAHALYVFCSHALFDICSYTVRLKFMYGMRCLHARAVLCRTRSGDLVRLVELLDEAKQRVMEQVTERKKEAGEEVRWLLGGGGGRGGGEGGGKRGREGK